MLKFPHICQQANNRPPAGEVQWTFRIARCKAPGGLAFSIYKIFEQRGLLNLGNLDFEFV